MVGNVIMTSWGQLLGVVFRKGRGSSRSHSDANTQFHKGTGPFPHHHATHWSHLRGVGLSLQQRLCVS